jgi:uroporphyrinogen decarboxylase
LLQALRGAAPERQPVWFMRQAGRSLPEYRAARRGTAMLDACLTPSLAAELTLQPVRRHSVDAAIFFSDIVVPLRLAGVGVEIRPGVGPVMDRPYDSAWAIAELVSHRLDDDALAPIREAVRLTVDGLAAFPGAALIGFAGAPFTLAAYLVEGRPSRDHLAARRLMKSDPAAWNALLSWTAELSGAFLRAQVEAGAAATQLFDSWVGSLCLADYAEHVAPHSARALAKVADLGAPAIHFGTGTGHLLAAMRDVLDAAGVACGAVGVDWRTPLDEARRMVGGGVALQGNIDPALLGAPWAVLEAHVRDVVARGRSGSGGYVVNLGHGVPPETDPDVLTRVVELVHSL